MTARPVSLLLFGIATALPASLAGQQPRQSRPAAAPLRPAISRWEAVPVPALNGARETKAAAVAGPDLTSEWVAIAVVAVVLAVVLVRIARD
jgi:hypothetical protein